MERRYPQPGLPAPGELPDLRDLVASEELNEHAVVAQVVAKAFSEFTQDEGYLASCRQVL